MGFIGLVADAATTIQQETDEITRFFSIAMSSSFSMI